ncbi:uncharacterized protein [Aristolochia californica]|uniref:uncharacterized protein n=1 Tax=Aristolochia californica TaxID=171875 RepID=UPI0035E07ABD
MLPARCSTFEFFPRSSSSEPTESVFLPNRKRERTPAEDRMDSPHKKISPLIAKKSSPSLRVSSDSHQVRPCKEVNPEDVDENQEHVCKDVALKPLFQKKTTKHFMSPTISAASKVASPRKKILVERNESLVEDSPAYGHMSFLSDRTPSPSKISQPIDPSLLNPDSSSLPYDPLTNYLSPRPRFLRYKPNSRLEFLRREKHKEELGLSDSLSPESKKLTGDEPQASLSDSLDEELGEQEDGSHRLSDNIDSESCRGQDIENRNGEEEDEEEEEEQRSWRGRSVLQCSFVLSFLFFGLCFTSSTYPSSSLPYLRHLGRSSDEGFLDIQDPLPYLTKSNLDNFSEKFLRLSRTLSTFVGGSVCWTPKFVSFAGEKVLIAHPVVTTSNINAEGESHSWLADDQVESFDLEEQQSDESVPVAISVTASVERPVDIDGNPELQNIAGQASELDGLWNGHLWQQDQDSLNVTEENDDEGIDEENIVELKGSEAGEKITDKVTDFPDIQFTEMAGLSDSLVPPSESAFEPDLLLESISETSPEKESSELSEIDAHSTESDLGITPETELNEQQEDCSWAEYVKDKLTSKPAFGVSLSFILATCITIIFLHLKARKASESMSPPTATIQLQTSESTALENITLARLEKEEMERKNNSYVNLSFKEQPLPADNFQPFYATHPPTVELLGEYKLGEQVGSSEKERKSNSHVNLSFKAQPLPADNFQPFYATHPPTVELLGEYKLGEQAGSSEKDPSLKLKTASGGESVNIPQPKELENLRACISFSSNKVKSSASAFSSADSLSYASFTVQGKLTKKQEGEAVTVVTTPVRRSSRIRNRVKSP